MKKYVIELTLLTIAIILFVIFVKYEPESVKSKFIVSDSIQAKPIKLAWGFPINSIEIDTNIVRRGQSLSDILRPAGISALTVDRIAKKSKEIFNVRKIKSGNNYYLLNKDTTTIPNVFVYEESAVNYIVYNIDSIEVYRGQKEIDTLVQSVGGVITTSLWNAFAENGGRSYLAVELADIFAWTVDFFGIQKGDQFKVIYDELYVEDEYVGIGKIHATSFVHLGEEISAYAFSNNNQDGYFDNNGNSLRKAFLKAPLKFSRISSRFSHSRMHPIYKIRRPHRGVDYAAPRGTPVYSIGDGTVVKKAYQKGGGGNYINIKHNSVYTSQYMHLHGYAKGMATGVRVKQGQLIGYVGSTGASTGAHLDFRIYKNGSAIDPLKVKAPPVEPISEANKTEFYLLRDSLQFELSQIQLGADEQLVIK